MRQPAGGGVEQGLGFLRRRFSLGREYAQVGVVGYVLSLVRVAENARQVTSQRGNRRAVKGGKVPGVGTLVRHDDGLD